jgi:crotonobetainyl-CoA:carnitine CoA-transferase CaiB-like acyl-CoA transferase
MPPGAAATAAIGCEFAFTALADVPPSRSWHRWLGARAAFAGLHRRAPWSVGGACRALRTTDGYVAVSLARPDDVAAVPAIVERDVVVEGAPTAWRLLEAWSAGTPAAEVSARLALLGVPGGAVPAPGQWWPQASSAEGEVAAPVGRVEVAAGSARHAAPLVVDLSSLWAGPLCAHLLGRAGATVVKVELSGRLDGARRGNTAFYDALHAGHDSVVVDLAVAADRDLLESLFEAADIVIEASRPRALLSWGFDPFDICARSPTTWVSITAYGRRFGDLVGFGDDVAMVAGLVAREPGDDLPLPCGDAIADPLTGMHAAVHALASHRAGGSRLLDLPMADVVAATVAWVPTPPTVLASAPEPVTPDPPSSIDGQAAPPAGRDTEKWRRRA